MHRRINFLSIAILLSFATVFSGTIQAQDKFRLSRPTQNSFDSNNPANYSSNSDQDNSATDNSSDFKLNIPPANPSSPHQIRGGVTEEDRSNGLTQVQLQKLADHDIILLIDKSGSMATPDCGGSNSNLKSLLPSLLLGGSIMGGGNTRWQWCRQQITQMSNQTQIILPSGFTVLLFDSAFYLFPHVNSSSLAHIFTTNNPGGSTNLTLPLSKVFDDYFKRQRLSRVKIKPLLVGIITDGCPDSPGSVKRLLVDLTHSLKDPNEITIVFFLIGGHDPQGERFARDLSQNLTRSGATFDIVKAVSFDQVQRTGLARALADNLE